MTLSRAEILEASDLHTEEINVPEWGGVVRLRTMTGQERDVFIAAVTKAGDDTTGLKARLICLTACNGSSKRLFEDDDLEELQAKSSKVIDDLFQVASRINGLGQEEVDELVGNS